MNIALLLLTGCTFISDKAVDAKFATDDTVDPTADADGDGYAASVDCDDADPDVHPTAPEAWYDGVDQDCDGADDYDQDGDGHASAAWPDAVTDLPKDDCYDGDADDYPASGDLVGDPLDPEDVHPGAPDTWYDGTDQDCAGDDDYDQDGDGFVVSDECDDTDASIYPNDTPEVWYNGVDENCDGNDGDQDGDGFVATDYAFDPNGLGTGDCQDDPASASPALTPLNGFPAVPVDQIHPGAGEAWYDGIDQDCAGDSDFDQDTDGAATDSYADRSGLLGDDCVDTDPTVHPGAVDAWYDGVDADCAGNDDDDMDADGHPAADHGGDDCDDTRSDVSPDLVERCDTPEDDDCSGSTNDEDARSCTLYYEDPDGDGYGADPGLCLCDADATHVVTQAGDCDPDDGAVNPAAVETCTTDQDDDCDGSAQTGSGGSDPAGCATFYTDVDGDGFGTADGACLCASSGDYRATVSTDCDDTAASVHPTAAEVAADGVDQDCDGVDTCFEDNDLDGYGSTTTIDGTGLDCSAVSVSKNPDDCDDTRAAVNPGEVETCTTVYDDDCDGAVDAIDAVGCTAFYADADGDGYGTDSQCSCSPSGVYTALSGEDCDETDAGVNPGEVDVCRDTVDEDCDGAGGTCTLGEMDWTDADFEYLGLGDGDQTGWYVGGAGDLDGDGLDDFYAAQPYSGELYVVLGSASPKSASFADATATWTWGQTYATMSGIGDFNGDGLDDVAVGFTTCGSSCVTAGDVRVVLGTSPPTTVSNPADLEFRGEQTSLYGTWTTEYAGQSVDGAGDYDGDGIDDMVVGAPHHDWDPGYTGDESAGALYLELGGASSGYLGDAASLAGAGYDSLGYSVSGGGDVNGDGYPDIVAGAPGWPGNLYQGKAVLSLGSATGTLASDAAFYGDASGDAAGLSVATAGDVDGDGKDDILVGTEVSELALFLGSSAPGSASLSAATAAYSGSVLVGCAFAPAGDVDADGFDDFLIGGIGAWCSGGGAWLVRGSGSPASAGVEDGGLIIDLDSSSASGGAVGGAGDVNADGYDDILIGDPYNSEVGASNGAAWLILGTNW